MNGIKQKNDELPYSYINSVREVKGAPVLKILDLSSSNLNDEALYQVFAKSFEVIFKIRTFIVICAY